MNSSETEEGVESDPGQGSYIIICALNVFAF